MAAKGSTAGAMKFCLPRLSELLRKTALSLLMLFFSWPLFCSSTHFKYLLPLIYALFGLSLSLSLVACHLDFFLAPRNAANDSLAQSVFVWGLCVCLCFNDALSYSLLFWHIHIYNCQTDSFCLFMLTLCVCGRFSVCVCLGKQWSRYLLFYALANLPRPALRESMSYRKFFGRRKF